MDSPILAGRLGRRPAYGVTEGFHYIKIFYFLTLGVFFFY